MMMSITEKIERLEQSVKNMGCNITEAREDLNTYVATVPVPRKGAFVVYTNSVSYIYDGDWCFRMLQLTEPVPFSVIETTFTTADSFVDNFKEYVTEAGKLITTFSSGFNAEQLEFYVRNAKLLT